MEVHFKGADITEARQEALRLVNNGKVEAFLDMGPLDHSFFSLLSEPEAQIKKNNLFSYVSILMAPKDGRLTLLTDTLINSNPGITEKVLIVENVLELTKALGIERPKIAALGPLELVNPALKSTLDAAILSKMSDRGQFGQAIVEGPLAMDIAESAEAAKYKRIKSPVPGDVDIFLFPDLESANHMAQFFAFVGQCNLGGILAGTRIPVIICSPLESSSSWLLNLALGFITNKRI